MAHLVIDDGNYEQAIKERDDRLSGTDQQFMAGCLKRRIPYGCVPGVVKATEILTPIPREEWPGLIRDGKGTWLHDLTKGKLKSHDQGSTNYCWAHGSVRSAEVLRVFENQTPRILSAESVAVPLTGGRNRGGYPEEALQQMIDHGACVQEFWPTNDRNESHADRRWQPNAKQHRIIRWIDVVSFEMQITCAIRRLPAPIGLGWWGHLVCQLDPIHYGGNDFGIGCDNSWGSDYGDQGYFELHEKRGTADLGAFAPLTQNFTEV